MRAKITNVEIGKMIHVGHTAVSRYRSGDRVPSTDAMLEIATQFNWDVTAQAIAKKNGTWHQGFEHILVALYGEEQNDEATIDGTPA